MLFMFKKRTVTLDSYRPYARPMWYHLKILYVEKTVFSGIVKLCSMLFYLSYEINVILRYEHLNIIMKQCVFYININMFILQSED